MSATLIKCDKVVTVDGAMRVIDKGEILIKDGRIEALGVDLLADRHT